MRLIMAASSDGFVAKGPVDDMSWLGPHDKMAFRLLSVAGSGVCGASALTLDQMPAHLPGRQLVRITRSNFCLATFAQQYGPDCALIGGQTLALAALRDSLVKVVHLCRSDRVLGGGQEDHITSGLKCNGSWYLDTEMRIGDTVVETWRE